MLLRLAGGTSGRPRAVREQPAHRDSQRPSPTRLKRSRNDVQLHPFAGPDAFYDPRQFPLATERGIHRDFGSRDIPNHFERVEGTFERSGHERTLRTVGVAFE